MSKLTDAHLAKYHALSEQYSFNECDGFSRLLADEMLNDGYIPTIAKGRVRLHNQVFAHHYWVELNGEIFDFRLKMWFGNNAPNGRITDLDVIYTKVATVPLADGITIEVLKTNPSVIFKNYSNNFYS